MKVGDTVPVTLAGHAVAQARVKELSDGTAVLIIPATQVTMAVRTELDVAPAPVKETETIITGVDRAEGDTAPESEEPVQQSAVEVGTTETITETNIETPAAVVTETTESTSPVSLQQPDNATEAVAANDTPS